MQCKIESCLLHATWCVPHEAMHDFLLAKEIVDEVLNITREKKLKQVEKVSIEIGQIALAHDGHPEHIEDISIDNLIFGIQAIAKDTILENTFFDLKKVEGQNWKLVEINGK